MAAIPIGSRIAARCQCVPSHSRSIDKVITPITIMAMPSACSGRGTSSSSTAATATANSGVKLLSAPEIARAHAPVGLERQQRDGGGKQEADEDEDQRAARVPSLPVEHEGRKRRE